MNLENVAENLLPDSCYSQYPLTPEGILTHYMSGIDAWKFFDDLQQGQYDPFNQEICHRVLVHYNVSAHYFISRDGQIYQWVPLEKRAWHAGESIHNGRKSCNNWMLGVEFASVGKSEENSPAYTEAQYQSGNILYKELMNEFGISPLNVTGHDIVRAAAIEANMTNTRKFDPGPEFDYERILR